MKIHLITHTPDPDQIVGTAARLCYSDQTIEELLEGMTPKKADSLVAMLSDIGHQSPFEHVTFTFGIEEVSRVLSHQLVRHRIASYSQRSQRYVNDSESGFYIPKVIDKEPSLRYLYIEDMETAFSGYRSMTKMILEGYLEEELKKINPEFYEEDVERRKSVDYDVCRDFIDVCEERFPKLYKRLEKKAQEDARYLLPNACHTSLIVTMNARTLLNFFHTRCCRRAQGEINELAWEMLKLVKDVAPRIFSVAGPGCITSTCPEGSMSCGDPY